MTRNLVIAATVGAAVGIACCGFQDADTVLRVSLLLIPMFLLSFGAASFTARRTGRHWPVYLAFGSPAILFGAMLWWALGIDRQLLNETTPAVLARLIVDLLGRAYPSGLVAALAWLHALD